MYIICRCCFDIVGAWYLPVLCWGQSGFLTNIQDCSFLSVIFFEASTNISLTCNTCDALSLKLSWDNVHSLSPHTPHNKKWPHTVGIPMDDSSFSIAVLFACMSMPKFIFSCTWTIVCLTDFVEGSNFLLSFHCGLLSCIFSFLQIFPLVPTGLFWVLSLLGVILSIDNFFVQTNKQGGTPDEYMLVYLEISWM